MASPAEIVQGLPEILPADFSDWDSEASPAAAPGNFGGLETAPIVAETSKPPAHSAERKAILTPAVDRPRDAGSSSIPPASTDKGAFLQREKLVNSLLDKLPSAASHSIEDLYEPVESSVTPSWPNAATVAGMHNTPVHMATGRSQAGSTTFLQFSSNREATEEEKKAGMTGMIVAVASAFSIVLLLILTIPLFNSRTKSIANQSDQANTGVVDTQLNSNQRTRLHWIRLIQDKPLSTTESQQTGNDQAANEENGGYPTQAQTEMMTDQLNAPARIPQAITRQVAGNAPPSLSFGAGGADGLGGSGDIRNVLSKQAQPTVTVAGSNPVVISEGVTAGLLIWKSTPIYPPIAKQARVSGTVELQVTISKSGTIKDLHVVSGPVMLRQAAVNAVRTWRYKPYRLNNEPIEAQTTVHVVFSLGG
jgi:TonB family protein